VRRLVQRGGGIAEHDTVPCLEPALDDHEVRVGGAQHDLARDDTGAAGGGVTSAEAFSTGIVSPATTTATTVTAARSAADRRIRSLNTSCRRCRPPGVPKLLLRADSAMCVSRPLKQPVGVRKAHG